MHPYRTNNCHELRRHHAGTVVRLSGWVHRKRDHGGLLFIDLRDHYGITQCAIDEFSNKEVFDRCAALTAESVITVEGMVNCRPSGTENHSLETGEVEIIVSTMTVQSAAKPLPFAISSDSDYPEDMRLKYRYLDLRRDDQHKRIVLRSQVIKVIRNVMWVQGFDEIQTPILTADSPEGARPYYVPSRLHPGRFYALPQAPQQFKQLLMVGGFDRYFQIAPCFRDEAARADRAPGEFYQLDYEMAFATQNDVFEVAETVMHHIFTAFGKDVYPLPFPRITYEESMRLYATDKPDLRAVPALHDVTDVFRDSGFAIFSNMIANDRAVRIRAVVVPGVENCRPFCDKMNGWAIGEGQPGLGYIYFRGDKGTGPIAKNIGEERTALLKERFTLGDETPIFFIAGVPAENNAFAAKARVELAKASDNYSDHFEFCWITDFPMYEIDPATGKIDFSHNPFSMPQGGMEALETQNPLTIKAYQYDLVCNGIELSSGAIRNHDPGIMYKAFEIAGYTRADVESRFGGMLNAFQFGAPPHGGCAPGIDRIVMLLAGTPNIREIIAFPMDQQARDLMMGAPSTIPENRLRELSLRVLPTKL